MSPYREKIQQYFPQYLKDLKTLVSIESISDENTDCLPFGKGVRSCFEAFASIAKRLGFAIEEDEGYAITAMLKTSSDSRYIGILGHLDVVEAGDLNRWHYPPFDLTEDEGILYGRGVNDDKGPLLAQLYCIKILLDLGYSLKQTIKVIAGGAEETTWHCMEHYFQSHPQPIMGYSPDGNFPIVNAEKGILTLRVDHPLSTTNEISITSIQSMPTGYAIAEKIDIDCFCDDISRLPQEMRSYFHSKKARFTFKGKSALTRNPHQADNALFKMVDFILSYADHFASGIVKACQEIQQYFLDPYGKDCGYAHSTQEMGFSTLAIFDFQIQDNQCSYAIDLRYAQEHTGYQIHAFFNRLLDQELSLIRMKEPLFVPQEDPLIQKLSLAYRSICQEEAKCLSKGGASYARVLDHGIAFGATFDGWDTRPHRFDENMRVEDLMKAMEIYCEAIRLLAFE